MNLRTALPHSQRLRRYLPRAIGPVIFLIVLSRLNLADIGKAIGQASPWLLALAYCLFIPSLLTRTLRWQMLMRPQQIRIPFGEALSIYSYSILVGTATPGRVGEFVKGLYLRSKGYSTGASFMSVLLDRLLDILFLVVLGSGAFFTTGVLGASDLAVGLALLASLLIGLSLFWLVTHGPGYPLALKACLWIKPHSLAEKVSRAFRDFSQGFRQIDVTVFLVSLAMTALAWAMNYGAVYFFGRALGFGVSFIQMSCITAVCVLVTLVPVSVLGLGTRDVVLITMLAPYGVSQSGAVALSALILSMLLANAAFCAFSLLTPAGRLEWSRSTPEAPP